MAIPEEAIIKANSPSWAREKPLKIDVSKRLPESKKPKVDKITLPVITTKVIIKIGLIYSINIPGSTSIPTEVKNTAPNKSFTGLMVASMRSASSVSAKIDPIMNAPKADENPTDVAIKTMPKHKAMAVKSNSSSFNNGIIFKKRIKTNYGV